MPLEGIDEDGLPKNPDLQLMQWRFLLTSETTGVDKDGIWESLLQAIKENGEVARDPLYCANMFPLPLPPSSLPLPILPPPSRYGPLLCVSVW